MNVTFQQLLPWSVGAVLAVFAMWMGGIVSSFWATLGILGFLVILGSLWLLPAFRRFAAIVFVGLVVVWFVAPGIAYWFRTSWPILADTLTRRSIDGELKLSELGDPSALVARMGVAKYCRELDRLQGEWVANRLSHELDSVRQVNPLVFEKPPLPNSKNEKNILAWVKVIEARRAECAKLILQTGQKTTGVSTSPAPRRWVEGFRDFFMDNLELAVWAIALLLVAGVAIAWLKGQMPTWPAAKTAAIIIAVAVVVTILTPEVKAAYVGWKAGSPLPSTSEPTRPEPVLMPNGALYLPQRSEFVLGAGTEQRFRFDSLGFVAIEGNHTIICDPLCRDESGIMVHELPVRTAEWKQRRGGKPCLKDKEAFYVTIRGDETTTLRARTPNDNPC